MVFDGSGELQPGIEEACDSSIVFCKDMDDCLQTEDSWCGLITESFNGGVSGITGDDNSSIFDLLYLLLKQRLSRGVFCEELDDCWQTEDSWGILMTELFNGGGTGITRYDKSFLFKWLYLRLNHRLSQGFFRCLPWLFPIPLLWWLPIPFGRGMMN